MSTGENAQGPVGREPVTPDQAEAMVSQLASSQNSEQIEGDSYGSIAPEGTGGTGADGFALALMPQVVWDEPATQGSSQLRTRPVALHVIEAMPTASPIIEPTVATLALRDAAAEHTPPPTTSPTPPQHATLVQPPTPAAAVASGSSEMSTGEVFNMMLERIQASEDPAVAKAVRMSVLSVFDPDQSVDRQVLDQLTPEQRRSVATYRNVVVTMGKSLLEDGDEQNLQAKLASLADKHGQDTIKIQRVELCKKVRGFGVYEPFDTHTFVTGRNQPMIIYVELDDFATKEHASDDFEVKLSQEVILFNKADGLAVWRQTPVQITDRSRNKRRDFFTVQMIEMPSRLTVGQFTLKVRVTDVYGNSLDEINVPLDMVADQALTSR